MKPEPRKGGGSSAMNARSSWAKEVLDVLPAEAEAELPAEAELWVHRAWPRNFMRHAPVATPRASLAAAFTLSVV